MDYIVVSLAFRLNISLVGMIICCPDEEQYFRLQSEMLSDVRGRQPCVLHESSSQSVSSLEDESKVAVKING